MTLAKLIFKIFLIITGIVAVAWFLVPPVLSGNFHIGNFTGGVIGFIFLFYGIFFSKINACVISLWHLIWGKFILIALAIVMLSIIILASLCIVSMARVQNYTPEKDSTLIVLGCHVYSYGPSATLKGRLDTAIKYLNDYPEADCVVCGGQGDNEPVTEASAMYDYLIKQGIDSSRIYIDDQSKDTLENLSNALEIINGNGLNESVAIVTNDYHLYRARQYALTVGFTSPGMIGSDTLWWLFPSLTVREMYGILEMWFLK